MLLGPSVELALGRARFVCLLCLPGALLALAAGALAGGDSAPAAPLLLGVAGASAAVLGSYLLLHPRARVLTLMLVPFFATFVELPALIFLGLWLLAQVALVAGGLEHYLGTSVVASFAHVGGFLYGLASIALFTKRRHDKSATPPPARPVYR